MEITHLEGPLSLARNEEDDFWVIYRLPDDPEGGLLVPCGRKTGDSRLLTLMGERAQAPRKALSEALSAGLLGRFPGIGILRNVQEMRKAYKALFSDDLKHWTAHCRFFEEVRPVWAAAVPLPPPPARQPPVLQALDVPSETVPDAWI